jgi:hypothetical protein
MEHARKPSSNDYVPNVLFVPSVVLMEHLAKLSKCVYPPLTNKLYRMLIVCLVFDKKHSVQNGYTECD